MTKRCPGRWRYDLVFGLLVLAVLALGVRLYLLMKDRRFEALRLAEAQQRKCVPLPARVGSIYLRTRGRYVLLAGSQRTPLCYVDPALLTDKQLVKTAIDLAGVLESDAVEIQNDLVLRRYKRYVPIKRGLTDKEVKAVRALDNHAVGISHEWWRVYPNGNLAATVAGFRRRDGVPGGGLEATQQTHLACQPGRRVVLADARRRPIWPLPEQSTRPRDGRNVFLCLDAVVQRYLQRAVAKAVDQFDAKWGTGVVVDPTSGVVLAMCSAPTFDPNEYADAKLEHQINRAVSLAFEPGSIAKPIFAAAAVNAGVLSYDTEIDTGDGVYYAHRGGRISDHGHAYGRITVRRGVVISSNILMAHVGERLGNERLYATVRNFGFGRKTGVPLPGESPGLIRDQRLWDGYSMRRVPFGQEMACTALQMTMAFCALANGGTLLKPRIIDTITDPLGQVVWTNQRTEVRRVLRPEVAAQTLDVLRKAVEEGTGKACRLDKWTSFGKTGTAQISDGHTYVEGAYTGSFVGGAPATSPRVICLISVYWPDRSKGYYGGKVAAPFVKDVLEQTLTYLNVPSDKATAGAGGLDLSARADSARMRLARSRRTGR